uniref:Uncharacterized protein n=1 Tax=Lygus hesperus TaxID=30085 RepID=A0A0K8SRG0_LYGHE
MKKHVLRQHFRQFSLQSKRGIPMTTRNLSHNQLTFKVQLNPSPKQSKQAIMTKQTFSHNQQNAAQPPATAGDADDRVNIFSQPANLKNAAHSQSKTGDSDYHSAFVFALYACWHKSCRCILFCACWGLVC